MLGFGKPHRVPESYEHTFLPDKVVKDMVRTEICPIEGCGSHEMLDGPSGGIGTSCQCGNGHSFTTIGPLSGMALHDSELVHTETGVKGWRGLFVRYGGKRIE